MSDTTVAAPAVEPAVPAATPQVDVSASQPAVATPQQPTGPLTKAEARRSVFEAARAAGESVAATRDVIIDATGRAHAPDGTFTSPPDAATAATGTEPAAATPQPGAIADQPAATEPQPRRVPIPEGHSLREQGLEFLPAQDEQSERAIRALLNTDVRRREVEAANARAQAAEADLLRYRALIDAQSDWQQKAIDSGTIADYEALKEVNPAAAERYLRGAMLEMQADADQRYQQFSETAEQEQVNQTAQQFVATAYQNITAQLPPELAALPEYGSAFRLAVSNYGAAVSAREAMGETVEPNEAEMIRFLEGAMVAFPTLRSALEARMALSNAERQRQAETERAAELERIRKEAAEQARLETAEAERQRWAAARTPISPLGQLPAHGDLRSTQPSAVDTGSVPIHDLKRQLKGEARAIGRAAFVR